MTVLAVVPARRGSKRLPDKNVRLLGGMTLVEHALRCAARAPSVDEVVVSTDDERVAAMVRSLGVRVVDRPPELATDDASSWSVVRHAAAGADFDVVVLLQPTSPLRLPEDVEATLAALAAHPDADGAATMVEGALTGAVYAWRRAFVELERERWQAGNTIPVPMPPERAIDVDTAGDLQAAEAALASGAVTLPWLAR